MATITDYRSHTGHMFLKFNVLNIHDTFKLNHGTFMYKHHSNLLPPIFSKYFTKHVQIHHYPTRNAHDYSINKTEKMFSDCAIRNIVDLLSGVLWTKLLNIAKPPNSWGARGESLCTPPRLNQTNFFRFLL